MKIKVCGMKFKDNIKEVASLQPDYLGFIFWEPSSRFFNGDIPKTIKDTIKKTGVFVDEKVSVIVKLIKKHDLKAIQLHGTESAAFCASLKSQLTKEVIFPIEIIKVFSIKDNFDFTLLKAYELVCDFFLFDTKGKLPGGNGYTFDWSVLKGYPSQKPYFLSGGIGITEIDKIQQFLKEPMAKYCYAIDVNSKFELEPGLKNAKLLIDFVSSIKQL
ncbi:phosphoribosylanthranilate isomerase [Ascidiimonas sp. W6]|uniref:phosphoribosylanthranilate isomerase n=1 Tax=Ascidiimonas meishanensis TaxID=3128903 RepID=UPI0030ED9DB7